MATDGETKSESPIPTTETGPASTVTAAQWVAMQNVLDTVYKYRVGGDEDHDPSKLFHRKVNRRVAPDYYDVIAEPIAMSTIKSKIHQKEYKNMTEYVRDWALIPHNAQVYNLPNSGAYQDALTIKAKLETEFAKLVSEGIMTEHESKMPFLGEIPIADDVAMEDAAAEEGDDDEGEDDEDDEDDDLDDSDEEGARRRRRRGARATLSRRDKKGRGEDEDDPDARKKRGRPPRVDTPMEARIKEILKSMRRYKSDSQLMIVDFERLPDKQAMPEYYAEIKMPMTLDVIKKKLKRKKYTSVDQFMKDVELMFENAKSYNSDESDLYKNAVFLQKETRKAADEVRKKPDTAFVMEDGRIPMPDGILHNGELWKVGDWVHIQNANDLTKPIVAQIYRTWQDGEGSKWVNACWYYRPEQTVHRFDRHFYEHEVVKTGQYRDHPIEEVVDRCFVMFFTRYNKGRPRGFPIDKDIYVCEARYNEEKHKINKIKTWASCLPDEVRDKDYEMDLYEHPKKMRKVPSPIKYLFKEGEQKETDELPKPVWGDPSAPPKIGAVHCRARDPRDSPPPEPTPTPPPPPPPSAPSRSIPNLTHTTPNGYANGRRPSDIQVPRPLNHASAITPTPPHAMTTPSHHTPSHHPQYHQPAPSPAPSLQPMPPSVNQYRPNLTPSNSFHGASGALSNASNNYNTPNGTASYAPPRPPLPHASSSQRYEARPDPEVYHLPEPANNSIPDDIRRQFQRDAYGRVLFFTVPPVEVEQKKQMPGHTAKYIAWKAEREEMLAQKRKREAESLAAKSTDAKRSKSEDGELHQKHLEQAKQNALAHLEDVLADNTIADYQRSFGDKWKQALEMDLDALDRAQSTLSKFESQVKARDLEFERLTKKELQLRGLGNALEFDVKP